MSAFPGDWSGEAQLWWHAEKPGDQLTLSIPVEKAGAYEVVGHFCGAPDYGAFKIQLGDADAKTIDFFHAEGVKRTDPVTLGRVGLKAGANSMTVTVTGKAENSTNYLFGLDALELKPVK